MTSFIIELVSNGSVDVYPENSLSSFSNFLPEQISLGDDPWEVGLMEIGYPAWYNNITEGLLRYKPDSKQKGFYEIRLRKGLYRSIHEIIYEIGNEMKQLSKDNKNCPAVDFVYDEFSGKINLKWNRDGDQYWWNNVEKTDIIDDENKPSQGFIHIASSDIASILGFPHVTVISSEKVTEAPLAADIQRIHSIMIYTDLIEHSIIGNAKAPILRCFPMISRLRDGHLTLTQFMNYQTFENIQFRKVMKNSFHSIKVDLRHSTGELIPFGGIGLTRLTLLFRQAGSHH